jgi:hypothetical protein
MERKPEPAGFTAGVRSQLFRPNIPFPHRHLLTPNFRLQPARVLPVNCMSTSSKRLAANRANAAKSTGPRTTEGKARSAQNAVKHGFTATSFTVVRLEELDEVERLKTDLISVYRPVNPQELFALERAALAQQAILRAARFEAGYFTACLNDSMAENGNTFSPMHPTMVEGRDGEEIPITQAHNRNYALATGFNRLSDRHKNFPSLLRYQAQAERRYRNAIEEFTRLQALREELPNEPIFTDELQPAEPVSAIETNPSAVS